LSNVKGWIFSILIPSASGCKGLINTFFAKGSITLGTNSNKELKPESQSLPNPFEDHRTRIFIPALRQLCDLYFLTAAFIGNND